MRLRLFNQAITEVARIFGITAMTAFPTTAIINQPSYASSASFFCAQSNGVPVTFARTQDGKKVPMVRWISSKNFPPEWNTMRRCQEVARRFQKNYDNGTLKYIRAGTLNEQPVLCAASSLTEPCTDSTLLFTLKRGSNAKAIVQTLLDRRGLASGMVYTERGRQRFLVDGGDRIFVDFNAYLNNATVESGSQSGSQPEKPSSEINNTP